MIFQLKHSVCRLALLFFCLLPFFGHTTEIILTPSNLHEVIDKINYLYGDMIEISQKELKSFLLESNQSDFDPQLHAPLATIDFVDDEKIAFSWPAIPEALNYQSRFLDLKTAQSLDTNDENNTVTFSIPNGLYLFAFSANSVNGNSVDWIIIEDKPLAFSQNTLLNCFCKQGEVIYTGSITSELTPIFSYLNEGVADPVLRVRMNYGNGSGAKFAASFVARFMVNEEGFIQNVVLPDLPQQSYCLESMETDFSFLWALDYGNNSPVDAEQAIRFNFVGESMKVRALDPVYTGSVQIEKCAFTDKSEKRQGGRSTFASTQVYPNPSTGIFTLSLSEYRPEVTSLLLKNQYGQTLAIEKTKLHPSTWQFDLSDYPDGLYWLQVNKDTQSAVYSIIKTTF